MSERTNKVHSDRCPTIRPIDTFRRNNAAAQSVNSIGRESLEGRVRSIAACGIFYLSGTVLRTPRPLSRTSASIKWTKNKKKNEIEERTSRSRRAISAVRLSRRNSTRPIRDSPDRERQNKKTKTKKRSNDRAPVRGTFVTPHIGAREEARRRYRPSSGRSERTAKLPIPATIVIVRSFSLSGLPSRRQNGPRLAARPRRERTLARESPEPPARPLLSRSNWLRVEGKINMRVQRERSRLDY